MPLPKAIEIVQFVIMFRNGEGIELNKNDSKQIGQLVSSLNKTIEKKFKYLGPE